MNFGNFASTPKTYSTLSSLILLCRLDFAPARLTPQAASVLASLLSPLRSFLPILPILPILPKPHKKSATPKPEVAEKRISYQLFVDLNLTQIYCLGCRVGNCDNNLSGHSSRSCKLISRSAIINFHLSCISSIACKGRITNFYCY